MVSAGYAYIACNERVQHTQWSQTRTGDEVELQVYVHCADGEWCLGYFHPNTMVGVSDGIGNWETRDSARIVVQDLSHSWAP